MDGVDYHKWFPQKRLFALPPGSVIVIDNAPHYSVKEEKVPHMSSLKKNIQALLSKKGVTWSTDLTVKVEGDTYCIDWVASEAAMKKGFVASASTTFKMKDLEPLVWKGIQQLTAEKWKNIVTVDVQLCADCGSYEKGSSRKHVCFGIAAIRALINSSGNSRRRNIKQNLACKAVSAQHKPLFSSSLSSRRTTMGRLWELREGKLTKACVFWNSSYQSPY
ncbi:hypothetical protein HPB47_017508 [Ixodes persulcatus]|uniref:Uncharacterized protein n=1 Tax=Ixodes persulcatus TaxID=34615 RepID=A0AC60QN42_IXOPE|nr:hypothetical protein HPB47_017508 [Ixodes persulcatus]